MWPCGVLVMLTELFNAESKSQVYAALHELLHNYDNIAATLSKYMMPVTLMYTHEVFALYHRICML